ncbi:hypothetical protein [Flavobacterium mekongense]|uniref:hypothetical protein n=1 Tax=Flavobacterium mekongense TaxID=3379707 RepID=UPI00399B3595
MRIVKNKMNPEIREAIKERQKLVWDSLFYSNQRMDLLIITISGAGLYTVSEVCKYLLEQKLPISCFIKVAAILFVTSIITNFLSQYYSAKTHYKDYCSVLLQLEEERTEKQDADLLQFHNESEAHNKTTQQFNSLSMVFMFAGLIAITLTLFFIF